MVSRLSFLHQLSNQKILGPVLSALAPGQYDVDPTAACTALRNVNLESLNTTILATSYFHNATEVDTLGTCDPVAHISEPLCRVQFVVNTSNISAITTEAWLPTSWNGRFLALGNGGLGGCISYTNLEYGSSLGFATVGSDNGHDGERGIYFANNSEVLADFTSRAVHTEAVVGKRLVAEYYGQAHNHSYYMACSTGGRQGLYAALHYPEDFDGVLAGAPAANFNNLLGWTGLIPTYLGAPNAENSPSFISSDLWNVIAAEVLLQCDGLDGVTNGIITEPDECDFRPEALLCGKDETEDCLTPDQIEALRKIYSPLYGRDGEWLYPRFDPGAEMPNNSTSDLFSGKFSNTVADWIKYVVYNESFDFSQFGLADVEYMTVLDPGNISTFSGNFSAFRERGSKLITYHGRSDEGIMSGISKALYDLVQRTLYLRSESMDDFYRLFLIPGMGHCGGGRGAPVFGQSGLSVPTNHSTSANGTQTTNIFLALVDWVENGNAPDTVVGESVDGQTKRAHCRYPMRSIWDGSQWMCQ